MTQQKYLTKDNLEKSTCISSRKEKGNVDKEELKVRITQVIVMIGNFMKNNIDFMFTEFSGVIFNR